MPFRKPTISVAAQRSTARRTRLASRLPRISGAPTCSHTRPLVAQRSDSVISLLNNQLHSNSRLKACVARLTSPCAYTYTHEVTSTQHRLALGGLWLEFRRAGWDARGAPKHGLGRGDVHVCLDSRTNVADGGTRGAEMRGWRKWRGDERRIDTHLSHVFTQSSKTQLPCKADLTLRRLFLRQRMLPPLY
jgi:hypothetical protein